jgi:hypothetical protein
MNRRTLGVVLGILIALAVVALIAIPMSLWIFG